MAYLYNLITFLYTRAERDERGDSLWAFMALGVVAVVVGLGILTPFGDLVAKALKALGDKITQAAG